MSSGVFLCLIPAMHSGKNVQVPIFFAMVNCLICDYISGKVSLTFGHANANFSVFIDRIRNQF